MTDGNTRSIGTHFLSYNPEMDLCLKMPGTWNTTIAVRVGGERAQIWSVGCFNMSRIDGKVCMGLAEGILHMTVRI